MKTRTVWFKLAVIMGIMGAALAGCAVTGEKKAEKTGQNLIGVGFQMKLADTPEKTVRLAKLPQRTIFKYEKDGKTRYVWADSETCKCVYVGSEGAYQRYLNLRRDKKLDQKDRMTREMRIIPAMDMQTWGPWGTFR
ncbi:MAG: hypothetical protein GY859_30785 [Desulfobacterales bacterium]|nr:hypothetical protein [Desulfobacterales bacterium]